MHVTERNFFPSLNGEDRSISFHSPSCNFTEKFLFACTRRIDDFRFFFLSVLHLPTEDLRRQHISISQNDISILIRRNWLVEWRKSGALTRLDKRALCASHWNELECKNGEMMATDQTTIKCNIIKSALVLYIRREKVKLLQRRRKEKRNKVPSGILHNVHSHRIYSISPLYTQRMKQWNRSVLLGPTLAFSAGQQHRDTSASPLRCTYLLPAKVFHLLPLARPEKRGKKTKERRVYKEKERARRALYIDSLPSLVPSRTQAAILVGMSCTPKDNFILFLVLTTTSLYILDYKLSGARI